MSGVHVLKEALSGMFPTCIVCRERVPKSRAFFKENDICLCEDCEERIDRFKSAAVFKEMKLPEFVLCAYPYIGELRNSFIRYKFLGEYAYAGIFAELMTNCIKQFWRKGDFDLIVPVPLSGERTEERGYNQSALIAERVAKNLGVEYSEKALFRIKNTKRQSGLSYMERSENIKGAFRACGEYVCGRSILLIDDVYTIGATMYECAKMLNGAGAAKVAGCSLFKTISPEFKNKKEYDGF